ncbi:MAG: hypothetical protein H7222_13045 [Methylotenera sp.]|nr:hypothetical protein [Oligoflexia bacterium]
MLTFSFLAGVLHALAPDHWIPASILVWQKGWSSRRSSLFASALLIFHILLGVGVYFAFSPMLKHLGPSRMITFTMGLVVAVLLVRLFRFSKIRDMLGTGSGNLWGVFAVVSLLGPCETIIPLLLRSNQLGHGYLLALGAFACGTLISGLSSIWMGRLIWNRPSWFPKGLQLAEGSSVVLPVLALTALGLRAFLGHF